MKPYSFDSFKQPDGCYIDANEVHHSSAEDYLCAQLGFCGCGMPNEALKFTRDALQLIEDLHTLNHRPECDERTIWEKHYDDWNAKVAQLLPTNGHEYFVWYFFDAKRLTEHGGSVPGWLTAAGRTMLQDLNAWIENSENETR